jgi:hypothetical protein
LLSSGKSIETSLDAMPVMIAKIWYLFLIIGKTHPSVVQEEGENRRSLDKNKIGLQHHVKFINTYLPLEELLDYLQLTDIYLFYQRSKSGCKWYVFICYKLWLSSDFYSYTALVNY